MTKQTEALKMLYDAVDRHRWAVGQDEIQSTWQNVCKILDVECVEALEEAEKSDKEIVSEFWNNFKEL